MRPYLPLNLLILLTLGWCLTGQSQTNPIKKTIYFSSGRYQAMPAAIADWVSLRDSAVTIFIEGHADSRGRRVTNQLLSRMRAESVKACLLAAGFKPEEITVRAWGAVLPVANNRTARGRQKNRRVEVRLARVAMVKAVEVPDIAVLYQQLATPLQRFCIDGHRDTILRCRQGTIIYIKANSLTPSSGCEGGCISFNVREDRLYSDMILDDLSTTSDGKLLETQGMLYTEAVDCEGKSLTLQKDLVVLMPTDSINPKAGIFKDSRGEDGIMNWTKDDSARLSGFTLPDLDLCKAWLGPNLTDAIKDKEGKRCPLFFCKIGRLFRRRSEEESATAARFPAASTRADTVRSALSLLTCEQLAQLFRSYGVSDPDALIKAINKPLLDSLGINSLSQLKDTLVRMATKKIELSYLNKNLSFDDFKYYIYNNSRLGWRNIDCFGGVDPASQVTVKVRLKADRNVACKLVFTGRSLVMPPTRKGDWFEFQRVPRGEKAIAVAIKYEDGQPFLAMKEIVVGEEVVDLQWKSLSLEELKQELRRLDR
ncbi:MAG: OmpA family protein [Bacteroidetes bacterium]|nr:OmpA family protein [Bacteroidota bacterium]